MEATTAMIVSELRAGCTPWKRLWALKTSKKHWLQHKKGDFSISYCSWRICLPTGLRKRKNAQEAQRLEGDCPGCRPGGAQCKGPPQVHEVLGARDEHFQNNCEKDSVRGLEIQSLCYVMGMKTGEFMSEQVRWCWTSSRRDSWACGRRRSGLPAHLPVNLWTILCVASLSLGSMQSLTTKRVLDPKDNGGDGVPRQGHRGEGLQEVQAQFWGCRRCWHLFHF